MPSSARTSGTGLFTWLERMAFNSAPAMRVGAGSTAAHSLSCSREPQVKALITDKDKADTQITIER